MDGCKRIKGKVPSGLTPEQLEKAKAAVLKRWRLAKKAETIPRIELAIDSYIEELTKLIS